MKESEYNELSYVEKRRKDRKFGQLIKTAMKHHIKSDQYFNRVAGGFSPPAPTPPGVRVRTGRFAEITGP
jgi:hypothetical protein